MDSRELPYISVIITAYNRKEFLLNAIKSVVNQTLDKKFYEIIVIKNFGDEDTDDFIDKNNIKHILINGTIGEFLDRGISEAKGEVVSFLDDDDLFLENKLDTVHNEFKKDANIVYYHNRHFPINKDGKTIEVKSKYSPDFNMSCISIKKSIVKINHADKIKTSPDILMYLYALESNKQIIRGEEYLTYYMFHNSVSNIGTKNFEDYKKFITTHLNSLLDSCRLFKNSFQSKKAITFLNSLITGTQIRLYLNGPSAFPSKLINFIIYNDDNLKYRIKLFLACILIKVYPQSRKYSSNRVWSDYCNRSNEMN